MTMLDLTELIAINIPTLVVSIIVAYLSATWAVRGALKERWWTRKEQAYAEIIGALYDLLRYSKLCAEGILAGAEHPQLDEFGRQYREAYWKIQKMTAVGPFVVSKRAAQILQELQDRPVLDWNENPPWEIYEADAESYRYALEQIRDCAKKDLKV